MIPVSEVIYELGPESETRYLVTYLWDGVVWVLDREYRSQMLAKFRVAKLSRKGYYARVEKVEVYRG